MLIVIRAFSGNTPELKPQSCSDLILVTAQNFNANQKPNRTVSVNKILETETCIQLSENDRNLVTVRVSSGSLVP